MKLIENGQMRVGGNTIKVWVGNFLVLISNALINAASTLKKIAEDYAESGKYRYVTNPSAKLINPFLLLITFTYNNNEKYQLVQQGDYKQNYKDCKEDGIPNLTEEQIFLIINAHRKEWFKKE